MSRDDIRTKIASLLADILDEDHIDLGDTTVAEDVPGWDSDAHVNLVLAIEDYYHIRFDSDEIGAPENVGALTDLIDSKLKSK